ncbi:MAG: ferredoxin [Actinomycetota bacterium]|nr:ferredoxin [Actinomycetota bacterium]
MSMGGERVDAPSSGPVASERLGVTIQVDRELCFGFGDCVDSAPDVFQLDDEDKSVVVNPDGAGLDDLLLAAQDCPVDAIFVVAVESGDQLYP